MFQRPVARTLCNQNEIQTMAQKFKMSLDAFEAEHERIGKHLAAARDSQTESGSYRLKLAAIRATDSRMGDMIVDAYASISEPAAERHHGPARRLGKATRRRERPARYGLRNPRPTPTRPRRGQRSRREHGPALSQSVIDHPARIPNERDSASTKPHPRGARLVHCVRLAAGRSFREFVEMEMIDAPPNP